MAERPILFSGAMVRAILAGTKTQTRRVCKPAQAHALSCVVEVPDPQERGQVYNRSHFGDEDGGVQFACPYGGKGDRLWVRESWTADPVDDGTWGYTAWAGCRQGQIAGVPEKFRHPRHCIYAADWTGIPNLAWTPSIHMPRWASRILLEITDVRVERLQDISEADTSAEGLLYDSSRFGHWSGDGSEWFMTARDAHRHLWEQINGAGAWAANPWVWAISFKRIKEAAHG